MMSANQRGSILWNPFRIPFQGDNNSISAAIPAMVGIAISCDMNFIPTILLQ
jgi:hypothetical protein